MLDRVIIRLAKQVIQLGSGFHALSVLTTDRSQDNAPARYNDSYFSLRTTKLQR